MGNFEFLNPEYSDLSNLFQLAENYIYSDPSSCMVKIRTGCENLVLHFYDKKKIPREQLINFFDLIQNEVFQRTVPKTIIDLLHLVRKYGNKAAHESNIDYSTKELIECLRYAHQISNWFYFITVNSKHKNQLFQPPIKQPSSKELIDKLKKKEEENLALKAELEKQQKVITPINEDSVKETKSLGDNFVSTIGLTEADTRRLLIDRMFKEAGWDILVHSSEIQKYSGKVRVVKEYKVKLVDGRTGYVDYVMFGSDDLPLGILEAKKTSSSAEIGKAQALEYANALEIQFKKRPVIFYSNGHDTYIWEDDFFPQRPIWGIYSPDKLEYLQFQKKNRKPLANIPINTKIIDRDFQIEGARRVLESFESKKRKALIVMATGTGKTRLAIAIVNSLLNADWGRKVLFLADRKELRDQAEDAFKEHIPSAPYCRITSSMDEFEKSSRLFTATYQTMMELYLKFPIDFFDIIIADETHRSIYNFYKELFLYFDTLQIGLTATPVRLISRNTFSFFQTNDKDPTFAYSYKQAIENNPPYLVRYKAIIQSTGFIREGIKYKNLSAEQISQLEESDVEPESLDYNREHVDRIIMNKETNKNILRNLMENGIRDITGNYIGKTILFARSIEHAKLLYNLFNEMYPDLKGKFAEVIVSDDPRASQMLKGFKGKNKEFSYIQLAISVDMLDTGVDVPEIVNLVFAKPIYSYVKFQQMIGRGTRICENLFGEGKHKTHFLIFDHWENFLFFDENPESGLKETVTSITEDLFSKRIFLLESTLTQKELDLSNIVISLLKKDISDLPERAISVKEKWYFVEKAKEEQSWTNIDLDFIKNLKEEITPLMRWRQIGEEEEAIRFDKKITELQTALVVQNKKAFSSLKAEVISDVSTIRRNLNQVKPFLNYIDSVLLPAFWEEVSFKSLEEMRKTLREIIKFRDKKRKSPLKVIDVVDPLLEKSFREDDLSFTDMDVYKDKVIKAMENIVQGSIVIHKIRNMKPLNDGELLQLQNLVLEQKTNLTLEQLKKKFSDKTNLELFLRTIIGLEPEKVKTEFESFRKAHTTLKSNQIQFLNLLEQEILKGGGILFDKLYDLPFKRFSDKGIDGVFHSKEAEDLFSMLEVFRLDKAG